MIRLTPELWLHSAFEGDSDATESRELDFNLSRRSGVMINHILGQMFLAPDTTTGFDVTAMVAQEVDVDPDNTLVEFAGVPEPDDVVVDSSRVFRQVAHPIWDTAAGIARQYNTILQRDWTNLPENLRPISITSLRHHVKALGGISNIYHVEIHIAYFIVELTLEELGIINASRR